MCGNREMPFLIGGPYFAQPEVREEWLGIPGLCGLVGGEVEFELCDIVRAAVDRASLNSFPGVWTDDPKKQNPPPLHNLDAIPFLTVKMARARYRLPRSASTLWSSCSR